MTRKLTTAAFAACATLALVATAPAQSGQPAQAGQGGAGGAGGQGGQAGQPGGAGSPFWTDAIAPETKEVPGFPSTLAGELPKVTAMTEELELRHDQAQDMLAQLIRDEREAFDRRDDVKQLRRDEQAAWQAYQAERGRMLDRLMQDDEYAAAVQLQRTLLSQIEAEQAGGTPDRQRLKELAVLKLQYGETRSAMEAAAAKADTQLDNARRRFLEVGRELRDLKQDFDAGLKNDPRVEELRRAAVELRIAYRTAQAYRRSLRRVANEALDFGYFRTRAIYGPSRYSPYGFYDNDRFDYGYNGFGGFTNFGFGVGRGINGVGFGSPFGVAVPVDGGFQYTVPGAGTGLGGVRALNPITVTPNDTIPAGGNGLTKPVGVQTPGL